MGNSGCGGVCAGTCTGNCVSCSSIASRTVSVEVPLKPREKCNKANDKESKEDRYSIYSSTEDSSNG